MPPGMMAARCQGQRADEKPVPYYRRIWRSWNRSQPGRREDPAGRSLG